MAFTRFLQPNEVPSPYGPVTQPLEPEVKKYTKTEMDLIREVNPSKLELRYVQMENDTGEMKEAYIIVAKNKKDEVLAAVAPCPPFCTPPPKKQEMTVSEAMNYVFF
jgi:hypothetical protein